ncbi:FxsA family protein [Saccharophagus degradans]|uniref:FxsA family protein n=1 Tax=Saccharophagus degradans TaxID=86304 RepID=A0AAW7X6F6_9GAMM|nr:FxsA family protein [Saccharophagus degradans]MBU2984489.1 FxsA family protein [Saccharophagus degradans]MDO6423231.1 FxsA family protein [Saccharophagus degradans]MDO6607245.1 FxsA family protein [Saccharophagus degradans]
MRILFLLFIVVPIIEIMVLIQASKIIGGWGTVGLILLTAMAGMALLRRQGVATLMRARQRMNEGAIPATEMVEGIFLAVGGALLLTPGFVTDAIGFCCLIPGVRKALIGGVLARAVNIQTFSSAQHTSKQSGTFSGPQGNPRGSQSDVIDGEFRREDD